MDNYQSQYNRDKSIIFKDVPLYKKLNNNQTLDEPINSEALALAIQVWLVSGRGEKLRTNTGGWLLQFLGKEMTDDVAELIDKNIRLGLERDFTPPVTVTALDVVADKPNKRWIIRIEGYNEQINLGVNTYAVLNNQ